MGEKFEPPEALGHRRTRLLKRGEGDRFWCEIRTAGGTWTQTRRAIKERGIFGEKFEPPEAPGYRGTRLLKEGILVEKFETPEAHRHRRTVFFFI